MRFSISLVLFLVACGAENNEPIAGVYDVESTETRMVSNPSSTTCPSNNPEPQTFVVEFSKENNNWVMYACDLAGNRQVQLATSNNGSEFVAHGCTGIWCENITFDLSFEKNRVEGTSVLVLTSPNSSGSCTQYNNVEGARR